MPAQNIATLKSILQSTIIGYSLKTIKSREAFVFKPISSLEVGNEIDQLHSSKKTSGELSTDVVKFIADNCIEYMTYFKNQMFANSTFPNKRKLADVSPIF